MSTGSPPADAGSCPSEPSRDGEPADGLGPPLGRVRFRRGQRRGRAADWLTINAAVKSSASSAALNRSEVQRVAASPSDSGGSTIVGREQHGRERLGVVPERTDREPHRLRSGLVVVLLPARRQMLRADLLETGPRCGGTSVSSCGGTFEDAELFADLAHHGALVAHVVVEPEGDVVPVGDLPDNRRTARTAAAGAGEDLALA